MFCFFIVSSIFSGDCVGSPTHLRCDLVSVTSQLLIQASPPWQGAVPPLVCPPPSMSQHYIGSDPRIPHLLHLVCSRPKMLSSAFINPAFQIGQGLNRHSWRWLITARIRIVNYNDCPNSIVVLRNWRGLSAPAIERSHYRDRYHRKSHYQLAPYLHLRVWSRRS